MKEKSFLQQQAYDTIKAAFYQAKWNQTAFTPKPSSLHRSAYPVRLSEKRSSAWSQDGYITVIPSKGFMIRQLNDKDMKDSIEIRCAIEGFCTNMVASQIDTEKGRQLLHSLEQTLSDMEESLENGVQLEHFIDSDHQFHLLLVGYMENDEFNQIFQRLLYLIRLTSQDALAVEGRIQGTMEEHRNYLHALRNGDGSRAYQLMMEHLLMPLKMHEK